MDGGGALAQAAETPRRTGLRRRMALFFALIAVAALALMGGVLTLIGFEAEEELRRRIALFGGGAVMALVGLIVWVGLRFDEAVAQPIERIARDMRAAAHGRAALIDQRATARHLGLLAPAAREMADALAAARAETDAAVAAAVETGERRRGQLEAVLRDLDQAVLICARDHRVTLYNRKALDLFGLAGELGLGRSVFSLVAAQPLRHAHERVSMRFEDGRHREHPLGLSAPFVTATADGARTLRGWLSLMLDESGAQPVGYVVAVDDATEAIADQLRRDRLLRESAAGLRKPVDNLRAVADLLPGAEGEERRRLLSTLDLETDRLGARLARLEGESRAVAEGAWPMSDMFSTALFTSVIRRRTGAQNFSAEIVGEPAWLHGDSVALVEMLDVLLNRIADSYDIRAFRLSAKPCGRRVAIDIGWRGPPAPEVELQTWLARPLDAAVGGITPRELLDLHRAELWCAAADGDEARLRVSLPGPKEAHRGRPRPSAARPEFYDFGLLDRPAPEAKAEARLRDLDYVVFDTETTGLDPKGADRIVSIAGVRVVNGRVLRGERFDRLMHPGRRIPEASARIHGVTDEMVAAAPPIASVLPAFHAFVGGSVLVAHNAAFDLAFLAKEEPATGVRFDQPVLDTVLLAAHLQGQTDSLTLDALAERFAIDIPPEDRHTALGDSLATAELLLRLFDMLEASGVRTLGEALEASRAATAVRRKQAAY